MAEETTQKVVSPAGGKVFTTAMFGFNREDVLSYIEELAAENIAQQSALKATIETLQKEIEAAKEDNQTILVKTKEVCTELEKEKQVARQRQDRIEQLEQEVVQCRKSIIEKEQEAGRLKLENKDLNTQIKGFEDQLKEEIEKCRLQLFAKEQEAQQLKQENDLLAQRLTAVTQKMHEEMGQVQNRLCDKEQEAQKSHHEMEEAQARLQDFQASLEQNRQEAQQLKDENSRLNSKIDVLQQELEVERNTKKNHPYTFNQPETHKILQDANEFARRKNEQMVKNAQNIGSSIHNLKKELATIENRIEEAIGNIKEATTDISASIDQATVDLQNLSRQIVSEDTSPSEPPCENKAEKENVRKGADFEPRSRDIKTDMRQAAQTLSEALLESLSRLLS